MGCVGVGMGCVGGWGVGGGGGGMGVVGGGFIRWFQDVDSRWPIVTSSILEPTAIHCDITITASSHVVSMDASLPQLALGSLI